VAYILFFFSVQQIIVNVGSVMVIHAQCNIVWWWWCVGGGRPHVLLMSQHVTTGRPERCSHWLTSSSIITDSRQHLNLHHTAIVWSPAFSLAHREEYLA